MLVDANLLLYSTDATGKLYAPAREWLLDQLNGSSRIGLPWQSLAAFLRVSTNPRISPSPLSPEQAWGMVEIWLSAPAAWVPVPGPSHAELLGELIVRYGIAGNLVPDAQLAALALEHGVAVCSTDTDFARFVEVRWTNPLAPA